MMLRLGADFPLKLTPEPKKMQIPPIMSTSIKELVPEIASVMVLVLALVV